MDNKILDIIDMSVEGDGIARVGDEVYFIDGAVEEEKVEAEILKQKDNLIWGRLVKIVEPSWRRAEPQCPYFDKCGGCKLMHLNKETQLLFKMLSLKRTIKKVTNLDIDVLETVSAPNDLRYRNTIQLKVERTEDYGVDIGFYEPSSHKLVAIDDCIICNEKNATLIALMKQYIEETNAQIESIFASFFDNNLAILVQSTNGECDEELCDLLKTKFDNVSLWASKQFTTSTLLNYKEARYVAGEKSLKVHFDDIEVDVTPLDFVQINFDVAKIMYDCLLSSVGENKVVLDLYSGLGITSVKLAQNGNFVCSIEQIENSVNSAKALAEKYGVSDKIIHHCGDCAEILPTLEFSEAEKENLVVFLDPPRRGAGRTAIEALKQVEPKAIIYMSCNPTSLAKDVRDLLDKYEIVSMQAFDMFPHANNIESLTILRKR